MEYKIVWVRIEQKNQYPKLEKILNDEAQEGWRVKHIDFAQDTALLEREKK